MNHIACCGQWSARATLRFEHSASANKQVRHIIRKSSGDPTVEFNQNGRVPRVTLSRRNFVGGLFATTATVACWPQENHAEQKPSSDDESPIANREVKVAAIQCVYVIGDILANLNKVSNMVHEAAKHGARWIVLPEYFSSGLAWQPKLLDAALPIDGLPTKLLHQLAKETGAAIAGTFLAQRHRDTFNTLVLAHPSGQLYFHDKDIPSGPLEAAHWIGGDNDGVFDTPETKVGAAICWEQIRSASVRRLLKGKVGLVLCPSAFGYAEDEGKAGHAKLLENAPTDLAQLVGAPVILANPVGPVDTQDADGQTRMVRVNFFGNSCIVDARDKVIAKRSESDGEGIVYGDIRLGPEKPLRTIPESYWIPEMPKYWLDRHEGRGAGERLYRDVVKPMRNRIRDQHRIDQ
jgi:predicted amidohydrolase